MAYPIKVFKSTDTGAPVLNGLAGTLIPLLDACFSTGYGSATLSTLASSGGVATAYVATGHGFNDGDILLVSGAGQAAYNGEFKISVVDTTHFTYPVAGSPPTPATGTIAAKYSPATGWTKVYSGTNTAAYKSADPAATGHLLRVDDNTAPNYAIVQAYEAMTDVDHGSRPWPTAAQVAANIVGPGVLWPKSNVATSTARPWILATDGRIVYFAVNYNGGAAALYEPMAFGDIVSFRAGDAAACILVGVYSTLFAGTTPGGYGSFQNINGNASNGIYMPRAYNQLGSAIQPLRYCGVFGQTAYGYGSPLYPNPADNALHLEFPTYVADSAAVLRGYMPGVHNPMSGVVAVNWPPSTGDPLANVAGFPGKSFVCVRGGYSSVGSPFYLDITGPWR